ncbi:MAG: DUF1585 domain-containing protein [Deltaproteobacteria bacterium]|nr:DUF1585 domain-containing protein [Deltaproteobacteria bacterium]
MRWIHAMGAVALLGAVTAAARPADASPTREQYRLFRALSIDLQGRIPLPDEIAAFERPGFDLDAWIDQHLQGAAYAERLRRVYLDALRLEVGSMFNFVSNPLVLRRVRVIDPDGNPSYVYFRRSQRRDRVESDLDFCLSPEETGITVAANGTLTGTAHAIDRAAWNQRTVEVRPWWLYRDYRSASPSQRISAGDGSAMTLSPVAGLLMDADNTTPTTTVRVCREEAQTADRGVVYLSGRLTALPRTMPYPGGRVTAPPTDSAYARSRAGQMVSCTSGTGVSLSDDCGCGVGLERCMPGNSLGNDPAAFNLPDNVPLGADQPLDSRAQTQGDWSRFWWAQEAVHFLDDLFVRDRDVRGLLTDRGTMVNGATAQFYRGFAGSTCCGNGTQFDYAEPSALFDPARVPSDLTPHDLATWRRVDDRGPQAAGILTTPIFLAKYGTRRARAHIVYNAFLCRQFVAENLALTPSTEPNLMVRSGCASCHAALEPLSAYFTRVTESGWTFLPPAAFPALNPACATRGGNSPNGGCTSFYDPAFGTSAQGMLRGAYGSLAHADEGPPGLARAIVDAPEFASCVVKNVSESFLGRSLTAEDQPLQESLVTSLRSGGFRMRSMVRTLLRADAYRAANNLASSTWREGAMP